MGAICWLGWASFDITGRRVKARSLRFDPQSLAFFGPSAVAPVEVTENVEAERAPWLRKGQWTQSRARSWSQRVQEFVI